MYNSHSLLYLGMLVMAVVANEVLNDCLSTKPKYTMNVVLLEDNSYAWNRPLVEEAVKQAIEEDRQENDKHGRDLQLLQVCCLIWLYSSQSTKNGKNH